MPESRRRKVYKAKKRPRVPYSNAAPNAPHIPGSRNTRIGVAILAAVIVIAGVVYVISRRNNNNNNSNNNEPVISEQTLPSGLRIQELRLGDGPTPQMGQTVSVNYIGRLENGQEFNNSYKAGRPGEFMLGGVIQGWNEALQTMKVGGKRRIFVPSKLAYGPQGKPPAIPPNSNLEFDIELLGIK